MKEINKGLYHFLALIIGETIVYLTREKKVSEGWVDLMSATSTENYLQEFDAVILTLQYTLVSSHPNLII